MTQSDSILCFLCMLVLSSCRVSFNTDRTQEVGRSPKSVHSITFLITVNDTWDLRGCIETVKTPPITPGNKSQSILVGSCDKGPLEFIILPSSDNKSLMTVHLTFHSSVIEDASPPTCDIPWNGTYLVPTSNTQQLPSLLPGCFTMDSREGYHMTGYWFYLLDWEI